jgi:hypothetical protein
VLTADTELQLVLGGAAFFGGDADHLSHPFDIDRHERVFRQNPRIDILRQELAGVVARQAEHRLGQIVGAETEEIGNLGDHLDKSVKLSSIEVAAAADRSDISSLATITKNPQIGAYFLGGPIAFVYHPKRKMGGA